jgi:hypothetical protein
MATFVTSTDGCHVLDASGWTHELPGRTVSGLAPTPSGHWLAVIDGDQIWQRWEADKWVQLCAVDDGLECLLDVGDVAFGGTSSGARLVQVSRDGAVSYVDGFDAVPGRRRWRPEGPPLHLRSITRTADEQALLACVHVGGIPRSTDGGTTWEPTIAPSTDVHEVRAHPAAPAVVMAASAAGLCESTDGGATWTIHTEGLPRNYALALAYTGDDVLFSIQDGPWARSAQLYRRPLAGGPITRVQGGLPEEFEGKVDTAHIAASGPRAAVVDGGGNVWSSEDAGLTWAPTGRIGGATGIQITPC